MLFQQDQYCIVDNKPIHQTSGSLLSQSITEKAPLYCSKECKLKDSVFQTNARKSNGSKLITYSTTVVRKNQNQSQSKSPSNFTQSLKDQLEEQIQHNNNNNDQDDGSVFTIDDLNINSYNSQRKSVANSLPSLLDDSPEFDLFDNSPSTEEDDYEYEVDVVYHHRYEEDESSSAVASEWMYETPSSSATPISMTKEDSWGYELSLANTSYNLRSKSVLTTLLEAEDASMDQTNPAINNYRIWLSNGLTA